MNFLRYTSTKTTACVTNTTNANPISGVVPRRFAQCSARAGGWRFGGASVEPSSQKRPSVPFGPVRFRSVRLRLSAASPGPDRRRTRLGRTAPQLQWATVPPNGRKINRIDYGHFLSKLVGPLAATLARGAGRGGQACDRPRGTWRGGPGLRGMANHSITGPLNGPFRSNLGWLPPRHGHLQVGSPVGNG